MQKVLALQTIPLFAKVSGPEMLYLAAIAKQIPLEDGAVLADETGPFGLGIVLSGGLALTSPDRPEPWPRPAPVTRSAHTRRWPGSRRGRRWRSFN